MQTQAERLKFARNHRKLSQEALAEKAGVSKGTIGNIESGTRAIDKSAVKLAIALKVRAEWLVNGPPEEMEPTGTLARVSMGLDDQITFKQPIELDNNPDYPAVRRVSVKASAGATGYAIEAVDDLPPIVFRADWYSTHGYRPERMLALKVAGESMVPSLYPGDLIVINTESVTPKDGVAFLVSYEGEIVVKRLQRDAGAWWLTSDNPDKRFARKVCDSGTQIIGEVVYKQSERI